MPSAVNGHHEHSTPVDKALPGSKRLVLCFDGTGNSFAGNTGDTNIVKLYDMLDRADNKQMHYYQPGIGTYTGDGSSVNTSFFGGIKRSITKTIDTGLATSFDSHVISGYRFLMRYYTPGDRIYIFGFSRGAFTARFLARMISHVGLLSMGNEEMVPFAYTVYQNYEMGKYKAKSYMITFRKTFCRDYHPADHIHADNEAGIKVHFLGLFDTVNSVGTLDIPWTHTFKVPKVHGTADHVRHAVAIDERRVKFKAALLAQESANPDLPKEDIKEVWFPGNHGDIGGGWTAESEDAQSKLSLWQKFLNLWGQEDDSDEPVVDKSRDAFQLSDIALKWMIDEIIAIPGETLAWNKKELQDFRDRFAARESKTADPSKRAIAARMHDTMAFGGGSSWSKTLFWNFMEYLPLIKRWEYKPEKSGKWAKKLDSWLRLESARIGRWSYATFPLNMGGRRDIPEGALMHHSVLERMHLFPPYRPNNQLFVEGQENSNVQEWSLDKVSVEEKWEEEDAVLVSGRSNSRTPLMPSQPRFVFAKDQTLKTANKQDWIYRIEGVST